MQRCTYPEQHLDAQEINNRVAQDSGQQSGVRRQSDLCSFMKDVHGGEASAGLKVNVTLALSNCQPCMAR